MNIWGQRGVHFYMRHLLVLIFILSFNYNSVANELSDDQRLLNAVLRGDFAESQKLLLSGADPNLRIVKNGTPILFIAVLKNNSDIVELLVNHGADLEVKLSNDSLLVKALCTAGAYETAMKLIELGAEVNERNTSCDLLAAAVAIAGSDPNKIPLVKKLLSHGIDIRGTFDDERRISPLQFAIDAESLELVKILVDANIDVNSVDKISKRTPLYSALYVKDNLQIFKFLLMSGADSDPREGIKPGELLGTAYLVNKDAIPYLLDAGADPNQGWAYYKIVQNNEIGLLKLFINKGANVDSFIYYTDITPLIVSASHGYTKMVRILIKNNADASITNNMGDTAFDVAIRNGHSKTACVIRPKHEMCR